MPECRESREKKLDLSRRSTPSPSDLSPAEGETTKAESKLLRSCDSRMTSTSGRFTSTRHLDERESIHWIGCSKSVKSVAAVLPAPSRGKLVVRSTPKQARSFLRNHQLPCCRLFFFFLPLMADDDVTHTHTHTHTYLQLSTTVHLPFDDCSIDTEFVPLRR